MENHRANQDLQERTSQLSVLEIILAAVVAAILIDGYFTVWSSIVGTTLWLGLHAYDPRTDRNWAQSAVFSALWTMCAILTFGGFFNFLWERWNIAALWQELVYVCKPGLDGTELAGTQVPRNTFVCDDGPFVETGSREHTMQTLVPGFNPGDLIFAGAFLVLSTIVFGYRLKRYYQPRSQEERSP
jgi:hypothetical protein